MLMESNVRVKESDVERSITIEKAFQIYREAKTQGGSPKVKLLTYNPIRKNFVYQPPSVLRKLHENNSVIALRLDMGQNEEDEPVEYSVIVNANCKIYGKSNNYPTAISTLALKNFRTGKLSIAYVDENNELSYRRLLKVYDPIEAIRNANVAAKQRHEELKREGNAVAIEPKSQAIPSFTSVRMETRDASLFVCDGLLLL